MSLRVLAWVAVVFVLNAGEAWALTGPITLFQKDGTPVETYDTLISQLRVHFESSSAAPIKLLFEGVSDGIIVDKSLGAGVQNLILSSGEKALRLPLNKNKGPRLDDYYDAWKNLKGAKVTTPAFLPEVHAYKKGQFILVDKVKIVTDYGDFTAKYDECRGETVMTADCDYCKMLKMNQKLMELAAELSDFTNIGDAHKGNVVFVTTPTDKEGRWILLDFANDDVNGDRVITRFSDLTPTKQAKNLETFKAFQNLYETSSRLGKNSQLDLLGPIKDLVGRVRKGGTCPSNTSQFAELYPLFRDLQLLCRAWMSRS